jgi:hypothetical protein
MSSQPSRGIDQSPQGLGRTLSLHETVSDLVNNPLVQPFRNKMRHYVYVLNFFNGKFHRQRECKYVPRTYESHDYLGIFHFYNYDIVLNMKKKLIVDGSGNATSLVPGFHPMPSLLLSTARRKKGQE